MRKILANAALGLGVAAIIVATLIAVMDFVATDPERYIAIHNSLPTNTGLDDEGVRRADRTLAAFLKGQGELLYRDKVFGQEMFVFNEREIEHMNDVAALFNKARQLAAWLSFGGAVLLAASAAANKKGLFRRTCAASLIASLTVTLTLAALAALAASDFSGAFVGMHGLLFANDLWLMNPATDLMIRLLPEEFFLRMAKEMALGALFTALAWTAVSAAGIIIIKRMRK